MYWTLPKTRSAPLSTRRRVRRNQPPHKAESAFGRYLLLPRPRTTSCRHSHFMLMFTNHENRPPFSRSALRTDRPFSSPGLLSNVWWADKPLSKVLRMRTTLTVTLLGLITLLVVTNQHGELSMTLSLRSSSVHLKECTDTTQNTYVYDYPSSLLCSDRDGTRFGCSTLAFLCVSFRSGRLPFVNRRASAILKGYSA